VNQSFVSPAFRARVRGWAVPVATGFGRLGLTPNHLTIIGFLGTTVAAAAAGLGHWVPAGILVLAFGIFDLFDGALARATGRATAFGAFLDSTLDRTGENLVYAGIVIGSVSIAFGPGAALAAAAMVFASVVTYTRAKAELSGVDGEVGFAPREVRLAVLGGGLILGGLVDITILALALGAIAILSAITVLQRIVHVRSRLDNEQ
jgi:CDP-diacylglycerol--glycerol-3-phosphate 3-phosphatidyltransferase